MCRPGSQALMILSMCTRAAALGLLTASAVAIDFNGCGGSAIVDHIHARSITLSPEAASPGGQLCASFVLAPSVPVKPGWSLNVKLGGADPIEYDLCAARGVRCPVPPHTTLKASICDDVPLAAMLHAGENIHVDVTVGDEAGAPVGCLSAAVPVNSTIAVDVDVESHVETVHHRLRRALGNADSADAVSEDSLRTILRDAYDASPQWAAAFDRWRAVHRKQYEHEGTTPAQALREEAAGFATFRDNLLAGHRAGTSVSLDERSDLRADVRRTLAHFA